MSCQQWFRAYDGWQKCGRPAGHKGAHTLDLLPGDPGYVSLREHRRERERREREAETARAATEDGPKREHGGPATS